MEQSKSEPQCYYKFPGCTNKPEWNMDVRESFIDKLLHRYRYVPVCSHCAVRIGLSMSGYDPWTPEQEIENG